MNFLRKLYLKSNQLWVIDQQNQYEIVSYFLDKNEKIVIRIIIFLPDFVFDSIKNNNKMSI